MVAVSMVGRAHELSELARAWAATVSASGCGDNETAVQTVVITGGAGHGKSLLAATAVRAFQPRPGAVLAGAARVHTPAPYDWLAAVLSGRRTGELPVPAGALAWFAQQPDASTERYTPGALLRLAVHTVRALVGAGPAVLVVDDLHALDPASLNLIGELATTPGLPALLLVTSRPVDWAPIPHLAARTLARLCGTPGAIRQHLQPLQTADVGAILAQVYRSVPHEVVQAVTQRTGGNPYWLTELLAATGTGAPDALVRAPLPEHVTLDALPKAAAPTSAGAELTAREREVLGCLAAGMSNKQVARSLGISIRTVAVHVSNLLRKTRSSSRTEAALWAVQRRVSAPTRPA